MADISIPGVSSRFDTGKMIDGLMRVERIPRDRLEKSLADLETQKSTWQTLGRRITDLRDGANQLYSYQNPFNEKTAVSSDGSVLEASVSRDVRTQKHSFTVKQMSLTDKFISKALDNNYKVPAGTYTFAAGENEVSFKFNGGSLREFSETLNRRGQGKIASNLIAVKSGTNSFVVESLVSGVENKLRFEGDALQFAVETGLVNQVQRESEIITIKAIPVKNSADPPDLIQTAVQGDSLKVSPMANVSIALNNGIIPNSSMLLQFETSLNENSTSFATKQANTMAGMATSAQQTEAETAAINENEDQYAPDTEESVAGDQDSAELATGPGETGLHSQPDTLNVVTLKFADGTETALPAIQEGVNFTPNSYNLFELSGGKTVSALEIKNGNRNYDVSIRNIQVMDTLPKAGTEPIAPLTSAQNAILVMDGIEIERPNNNIDDIIPGLNIKLRTASEKVVDLAVESNNEAVKDAIITLVGSYNRLMTELNVLTRGDEKIINEISYLNTEEREALRSKLGTFAGDTSLNKLRNDLINIATASYQTSDGESVMLADFGIATDVRRAGAAAYDPSRMRGYLEIDENVLDETIAGKADALKQLMGRDSDSDLIVDSGLAYALDRVARPFVEIGGIIASKTGGIDSRISADNRRMETLDRSLERKEAELRAQYGKMEDAYSRMEQMSRSLDNFGSQNNNKR
ncbi:MAG: flagellar filament capping protein FliD [Spirochaetaceae bacterium]|jgi:flagellar hook-associated protein 2|nr:flagellar filament capping protein FliD [Spirochaetaceae bacterium]